MEILGENNEYTRSIIRPARTMSFSDWLIYYYEENRPPYRDYLLTNGWLSPKIKIVKFENLRNDLDTVLNKEFKLNIDLNEIPHAHKSERNDNSYLDYYKDRTSIDIINIKYRWTFDMGFYKRL